MHKNIILDMRLFICLITIQHMLVFFSAQLHIFIYIEKYILHTHTHTHTRWFLWFTGTFHRRNGFYTVQAVCAIALHLPYLNLALTGDGAFLFSLKKTHSVWFISVLNYGDTENVLINHLLLVIPMSYHVIIQICVLINHINMPPPPHTHTHT